MRLPPSISLSSITSTILFILLRLSSFSINMRAVVLLCLLHTALGQTAYSWDAPGHVQPSPGPNEGNACQSRSYCGCCVMTREMNRLKSYFNTSLNMLETELIKVNQTLQNMEDSRTAVSAALLKDQRCYGPFPENKLIIYKHVFLNLGNAYNATSGIFTAPHSGVYSIALTVYSDAGAPQTQLAACAGLQVNGTVVAGSTDKNYSDQEDSSSIVVVLHLDTNDKVSVKLPVGCFLCDDSSHYNTFSVFLLYLTE